MRNFFEPTAAPVWLRQVLSSIRAALGDIWPAPLRLKDYATADLPAAADFAQGLAWNPAVSRLTYSDGSAWLQLQPYDATLAALAGLDATAGILVQTAADTFARRTLAAPAAGLAIANPAGIAGNPTFALANDLAALEALGGTNTIYYRSGADAWSAVTIGSLLSFSGGTLNVGDAELAAFAGLASAAAKIGYFTGAGTMALADFDAAAVNTSHTPTVSAQSGTFTTTTASFSYVKVGKLVLFSAQVTMPAAGTAAGAVQLSLPHSAAAFGGGLGEEYLVTGVSAMGKISGGSSLLRITGIDGTTSLIASGKGIRLWGCYLAA